LDAGKVGRGAVIALAAAARHRKCGERIAAIVARIDDASALESLEKLRSILPPSCAKLDSV
jgi:hypothetical protein